MNQDIFPYPIKRIGIIGGGQLGKMTAQVAKRMGFYVTVLDPTVNCPAAHLADKQIVGGLYEADKLRALAQVSEVLTLDVEHVDVQTLQALASEGHQIYPSPTVLAIIQDKLLQKQMLAAQGIPVPRFQAVDEVTATTWQALNFPVVQKTRWGGYDGKGVMILRQLAETQHALPPPFMLEEFIDFTKELAIIIARTASGETACYPVVEMTFDDRTNICDMVVAPARITTAIAEQARQVALQAVETLGGVGIFGVEMFLTRAGQILINEIAPRPHNSGHYTIEACTTCQFEQLVRIISGLPLGATDLLKPVIMFNLLGEEGYSGQPIIEGLRAALTVPGLTFHFYDKETTRPFRKMGHVTIIDDELDKAMTKVQQVRNVIKIKGKDKI